MVIVCIQIKVVIYSFAYQNHKFLVSSCECMPLTKAMYLLDTVLPELTINKALCLPEWTHPLKLSSLIYVNLYTVTCNYKLQLRVLTFKTVFTTDRTGFRE